MSKDILLLGEFSTGKSAFLNMLLGVQILPEQLDSTNLPVVKIQAGKPGGIWLRESGQNNPRAIESWSDIPEDWNDFEHAEVTVSGHPYLDKGLVFWDTPGINTTNAHHKQHLDDFLRSKSSDFISVLYFVSGNLTSTSIEFLKQNRALWTKMTIIVNIKEVMQVRQAHEIEIEVKKTVRTQLGNLPVELLYIGDACEEFNEVSDKNRAGLSDYELMWKWSDLKVDLAELLERHDSDIVGSYIFDIILTYANMSEPESDGKPIDEKDHSLTEKKSAETDSSTLKEEGRSDVNFSPDTTEDLDQIVKSAKSSQELALLFEEQPIEAFALFRKAAELGHPEAQYQLGECYMEALGVEESVEEGNKWYLRSAELGHPEAQYQLGCSYNMGLGVEESEKDASIWLKKAAEQGHVNAIGELNAIAFGEGLGVEESEVEAFKLYLKAAELGHPEAQYELGGCYLEGSGVEESEREAFKWYKKAGEQGNADAMAELAIAYEYGNGVEESKVEAFKWYLEAAEQGNSAAILWYIKVAERGDAEAQFWFGKRFYFGYGDIEQDGTKAVGWLKKAAKQGHSAAMYMIGLCLDNDVQGIEKDVEKARKWFKRAAKKGHAAAKIRLM
jgi:TPR repeat protein